MKKSCQRWCWLLLGSLMVGCGLVQINGKPLGGETHSSPPQKAEPREFESNETAEPAPPHKHQPKDSGDVDSGPRRASPVATPTVDHSDGVVVLPAGFSPAYVLFYYDCPIATGGANVDVFLACGRTKKKSMVCRWVGSSMFALDPAGDEEASKQKSDAFSATVLVDNSNTLSFATASSGTSVQIKLKAEQSTLTRRADNGEAVVCKGTSETAAQFTQILAKFRKDVEARRAAEEEENRVNEGREQNEPERTRPTSSSPRPKGSERGRMCGKDSDCQSGSCEMQNRTRGTCK
ncbi:MAG TPA: hypothetical protein PLF40_11335 [Kofleriaceae bacterium]|jgi:hypothetical protein|nr:hypothetical protein [Kofleriaceae bacterium]